MSSSTLVPPNNVQTDTNQQSFLDGDELVFKVVVVGPPGVGKTSLIRRYTENIYTGHYHATIGCEFAMKLVKWTPETFVRLQVWDIGGHNQLGSLTKVYYRDAAAAIAVFDVTSLSSFQSAIEWKEDFIEKFSQTSHSSDSFGENASSLPVIILANKVDLATNGWFYTTEDMDDFCAKHNILGWFEVSAKEDTNVEKAMMFLISKLLDRVPLPLPKKHASFLALGPEVIVTNTSTSCCS